jgi:prevent-host-death family protein
VVKTIEIRDINGNLRELINIVAAGDDVIIADSSTPVARLSAIRPGAPKGLGEAESGSSELAPRVPDLSTGKIWIASDFDAPLPDEFWFGTK